MHARSTIVSHAITSLFVGFVAACGPGSRAPAPTQPVSSTESLAKCVGRSATICPAFGWQTVVDNGFTVPGDTRKFNSYNQPSVNANALVVFRGRSKGGVTGEPAHGVFTRDMAAKTPVTTLFDRTTLVPPPNNRGTTFVEPPSFPRIDVYSSTVASRGNHPPVWTVLEDELAGTTGIYTDPFGSLIAGESNLGAVPGFQFFAVPDRDVKFDVFPGAPSVTDGATIVFKGNFTVGGVSKTGVYYRDLTDANAGGTGSAVLIADSDTLIPGEQTAFGSTAPPSAVGRQAVFAGFDNEDAPTFGGIYLAPLTGTKPELTPLVQIGERVPGEKRAVFNKLGEGVSFDGRFVAFWGAWGDEKKTLILQCPSEGNKARVEYCKQQYPNGFTTSVPVHQGIFVHDTRTNQTRAVAKAPSDYDDFVYWNFSGVVPGSGESEDTGEPARWRSASFVAVSGLVDGSLDDAVFHAAFKARTGDVVAGAYVNPIDGIYLRQGPGQSPFAVVVQSGADGTAIDPKTPAGLLVTEMGIERDGFRGDSLVVNVTMGAEETGWAGIYLTTVPEEEQ